MVTETGVITRDKDGKPILKIRGYEAFKEEVAEEFLRGEEEGIVIAVERQRKDIRTLPQLSYLYGHLAPLALQQFRDYGWEMSSKEDAITELKIILGFCKVYECPDQDLVRKIPKSLSFTARTNRKQVTEFVNNVFFWLLENGSQPMRPEEYEKMKKL